MQTKRLKCILTSQVNVVVEVEVVAGRARILVAWAAIFICLYLALMGASGKHIGEVDPRNDRKPTPPPSRSVCPNFARPILSSAFYALLASRRMSLQTGWTDLARWMDWATSG